MICLFFSKLFFHSFSELIVSRLENIGIDLSVDPTLRQLLNDDSFIQSMWINVNSDSRLEAYCKNNARVNCFSIIKSSEFKG